MSSAMRRRLVKDLKQLKDGLSEGTVVAYSSENISNMMGIIIGPAGTPFEGGHFEIRFNFTDEYPNNPPKCFFATKIFHPNISASGEICVNTLKKDWQPKFGVCHILDTVKCLLIHPNPESALNEEAGKLLLEDYESYCERAKLITSVHALPKDRSDEFDTYIPEDAEPSSNLSVPTPSLPMAAPAVTVTKSPKTIEVTTNLVNSPPLESSQNGVTTTTKSLFTPLSFQKTASLMPTVSQQQQPLQSCMSAKGLASPSEELMKSAPTPGVLPLGNANSNSPTLGKTITTKMRVGGKTQGAVGTGTEASGAGSEGGVGKSSASVSGKKPVKRPAGASSISAGEKRKKALRRL